MAADPAPTAPVRPDPRSAGAPAGADDPVRAPLDPARIGSLLAGTAFLVRHRTVTDSTQQDVRGWRPPGRVPMVTAEEQSAGRGRHGRVWTCPPGAGLMFSVGVPLPRVPPAVRGWAGALLGLAAVAALDALPAAAPQARPGVSTVALKWPNDVLVGGAKCAGILAEADGDRVVVGMGLNVSLSRAELPRPDATSLALAGVPRVDRAALLADILTAFADLVRRGQAAEGDIVGAGLHREYLARCATVGAQVAVGLPGGGAGGGGGVAVGRVVDVDAGGRLVLDTGDGRRSYAAGDVVHVRAAG